MDNNSTALSCEVFLVKGRPLPFTVRRADTILYAQAIYYVMLLITGTALNSFVIFIIVRFKKLHTITFYLALQIIITNQINALVFLITSPTNAIAREFVFTGLCATTGFILLFLQVLRHAEMLVLVADRFSLIFMPFWYTRHRVKVIVPLIMASWVLAFILAIIPVPGLLDCYGFQRFTWTCAIVDGCKNPRGCNSYRTFVVAFLNIGTFIGFLLYLALLYKAKKLRNRVEITTSSEESAEVKEIMKRQRQSERRANTTFLIMFAQLVSVSFLGFLVSNLGNAILQALNVQTPPPFFGAVSVVTRNLLPLTVILDPIAIMRNQDIKEVMRGINMFGKSTNRSNGTTMTSRTNQTDIH